MKIILVCPNCRSRKVIPITGLVNSKNIEKLFKDNSTYCEICKSNNLGNIVMNVEKFDREKTVYAVKDPAQKHVPTFIDLANVTEEQLKKKEELKSKLVSNNSV